MSESFKPLRTRDEERKYYREQLDQAKPETDDTDTEKPESVKDQLDDDWEYHTNPPASELSKIVLANYRIPRLRSGASDAASDSYYTD